MSSFFSRGCIPLAIVLAMPWPCLAQRGSDATGAYADESPTGGSDGEPPRLLRGGIMQQLRSVTESVLGMPEERRMRNYAGEETTRGAAVPETDGGNRSWGGQFLTPNQRLRDQVGLPRPRRAGERPIPTPPPATGRSREPDDRLDSAGPDLGRSTSAQPYDSNLPSDRRLYLGQPKPGQPNTPVAASPLGGSLSRRPGDDRSSDQRSGAPAGVGTPVEEGVNDKMAADANPPEVVVSHVPEVPYVPRKPLPRRDAGGASSESNKPTRVAQNTGVKPWSSTSTNTSTSTSTNTSSKPAAVKQQASSPSVPSLESPLLAPQLPPPSAATGSVNLAASGAAKSPTQPAPRLPSPSLPSASLPTASAPSATLPAAGLPAAGLLSSSLPSPAAATSSLPSSSAPAKNLPTSSSPTASARTIGSGTATLPATTSPLATSSSTGSKVGGATQERMHMEIPHVVVQLMGPGDLTTGLATGYELVVSNPDRIRLSGLILRMEMPPGVAVTTNRQAADEVEIEKAEDGATLLTWNVAEINAGASARLPLELTATASRNFAVAIEWTVLPQAGMNELIVNKADLQVAMEGPVDVDRNVPNVYRLRVTNPGSATARNVKVQVTAAAQPASQVEVGDLPPGESQIIEMDLTFEKLGRIEIGVHALADGQLQRGTNIGVHVRQAVLEAKLTIPTNIPRGSTATATVALNNSGDGPARHVKATLTLPPKCEVVNSPSGVTRQGDRLIWEVEQIPAGQLVTVPIELRLASTGACELKLTCSADGGTTASAQALTTIEAFADLQLSVNDPQAPAPIGAPVTYEIDVINRGTCEARNVKVIAQFSEGIEPQSATGFKHRIIPGQVLFEPIPAVAAGETIKIQVVAKASVPGMHRFRAEVRCEETEARLVDEESTRYLDSAARIASPPASSLIR